MPRIPNRSNVNWNGIGWEHTNFPRDTDHTDNLAVKFDGAKLPAILNSLETTNNGQKLVLEVAVRAKTPHPQSALGTKQLTLA